MLGPDAGSLIRFRSTLMRAMVEGGHDVLALAPDHDEEFAAKFAEWGIDFGTIPMSRTGLNPVRDMRTTVAVVGALRDWSADTVLASSAKPVVYGLLGARIAGVRRRAAMIPGAGSALRGGGRASSRVVSLALRLLYRMSLRQAQIVYFQNADDEALFRSLGLVGKRQQLVRINGSGVDLDRFPATPLPQPPITFVMVARLLRDKGVVEYVEAARVARATAPGLRFRLVGPLDDNPTAITAAELAAWEEEGAIEYLGATRDVRPYFAEAHVCVLPSYHEGTPRAVLEAMSMGRAVLTTDVPGCRETVRPGSNGYLVPAQDPAALAEAMLSMARDEERLQAMGQASRALAEERFDVHDVNRVILGALLPDGAAGE